MGLPFPVEFPIPCTSLARTSESVADRHASQSGYGTIISGVTPPSSGRCVIVRKGQKIRGCIPAARTAAVPP